MEKITEIDTHVGAAMSGLVADARTLVDHARVEAQNHRFTYDEPIGVEALTQGEWNIYTYIDSDLSFIYLIDLMRVKKIESKSERRGMKAEKFQSCVLWPSLLLAC